MDVVLHNGLYESVVKITGFLREKKGKKMTTIIFDNEERHMNAVEWTYRNRRSFRVGTLQSCFRQRYRERVKTRLNFSRAGYHNWKNEAIKESQLRKLNVHMWIDYITSHLECRFSVVYLFVVAFLNAFKRAPPCTLLRSKEPEEN